MPSRRLLAGQLGRENVDWLDHRRPRQQLRRLGHQGGGHLAPEEIGLLRALGLTRGQLRAVVRTESALITLVGGVLGIGGGYLLGAMFQRAALRTGLLEAAVPVGQLALALAGLAVAGVLAAGWPARRAARTDILTAIATE